MPYPIRAGGHAWDSPWRPTALFAIALMAIAVTPMPLVPVAQAIYAACERIPVLAAITSHVPPLFLAFVVLLVLGLLITGGRAGVTGFVATMRFNRDIARSEEPLPDRLVRIGGRLGSLERLTYLPRPQPMAFCYGFRTPRIAVTEGLLTLLDDTELLAVLAHEQEHLRRRDPLRYLIIDSLAAAVAVLPISWALRTRFEAEIELAADRAALAVAPRAALAGALLALLSASSPAVPGLAGLSATEARIANLSGQSIRPPLPAQAVAVTLALASILTIVSVSLARSGYEVSSTCVRCMGG